MWDLCPICNKPLVNESNLWKFRALVGSITVGGGVLGSMALPFIGFAAGGVAAGSYAAAWQSVIGNVAAGSLFAILQSLGATGLGTILFGTTGTALGLLTSIAAV